MFAVIMVLGCLVGFVCQGFFKKLYTDAYTGPTSGASAVFATMYGLIVGLATAVFAGFHFIWHGPTMVFALLNGIVLFAYNLSTVYASATGPYALQSLTTSFGGIVLPMALSLMFWGDSLPLIRIAGILLMLVAFVLYNSKGLQLSNTKKGYYLWIVLLFIANGCYNSLNDAQQRVTANTLRTEMIIGTFIVSAMISLVWLLVSHRGEVVQRFQMPGKAALFMMLSCLPAAAAANIQMATLQYVPAAVLFPILSGGLLILNTILSVIVLHERVEKIQVFGIFVAVVSLILLKV